MIKNNKYKDEVRPNLWLEILIFLSSYYPLFLILLIKDIKSVPNHLVFLHENLNLFVSYQAVLMFVVSSISLLIVYRFMRKNLNHQNGGNSVIIKKSEQIRGDMINYNLPFLIGLFAFDYSSIQSYVSLLIFLFFVFLFSRLDRFTLLNPMFLLMGINLYKIEYEEIANRVTKSATALCLGEPVPSKSAVGIKEIVGVHFLFQDKI